MKKNILIIDDEKHIAEGIRLNLEMQGHNTFVAFNGRLGLEAWQKSTFDLVIVDLMMPEIDGVGVIKKIRLDNPKIPILVISAKDEVREKIKILGLGVDDYLSKPFNLDEFLLRVDRLLLRGGWTKGLEQEKRIETFSFGNIFIDFNNIVAKKNNETIVLTMQEIKLLQFFVTHPNRVLTREEILENALGYDRESSSRTLDNYIVRFRKYFEDDPKTPKYFKSVRSVGYIFEI
jgi:DNA-binding response OmpR family regulator